MKFSGQNFHKFHIVDESPWPIVTSLSAMLLLGGSALYMHGYARGLLILFMGLILLISCMSLWWRDVVREGTFQGMHTTSVQEGLRIGMIYFIISEVVFFSGFFWAFFHSSLAPTLELGGVWPPPGLLPIFAFGAPFFGTCILVLSGATVTYAHHYLIAGNYLKVREGLILTIVLGVLFTVFQFIEFLEASFNISDSVYGSVFYMLTGFHGFHVIIGTTFLVVCFFRTLSYHFSRQNHVGLEAAIWYWHFVDVVWLFLFITVYGWGNSGLV